MGLLAEGGLGWPQTEPKMRSIITNCFIFCSSHLFGNAAQFHQQEKEGTDLQSDRAGFEFQVNVQEPFQAGTKILMLQTEVQKPGEIM